MYCECDDCGEQLYDSDLTSDGKCPECDGFVSEWYEYECNDCGYAWTDYLGEWFCSECDSDDININ